MTACCDVSARVACSVLSSRLQDLLDSMDGETLAAFCWMKDQVLATYTSSRPHVPTLFSLMHA